MALTVLDVYASLNPPNHKRGSNNHPTPDARLLLDSGHLKWSGTPPRTYQRIVFYSTAGVPALAVDCLRKTELQLDAKTLTFSIYVRCLLNGAGYLLIRGDLAPARELWQFGPLKLTYLSYTNTFQAQLNAGKIESLLKDLSAGVTFARPIYANTDSFFIGPDQYSPDLAVDEGLLKLFAVLATPSETLKKLVFRRKTLLHNPTLQITPWIAEVWGKPGTVGIMQEHYVKNPTDPANYWILAIDSEMHFIQVWNDRVAGPELDAISHPGADSMTFVPRLANNLEGSSLRFTVHDTPEMIPDKVLKPESFELISSGAGISSNKILLAIQGLQPRVPANAYAYFPGFRAHDGLGATAIIGLQPSPIPPVEHWDTAGPHISFEAAFQHAGTTGERRVRLGSLDFGIATIVELAEPPATSGRFGADLYQLPPTAPPPAASQGWAAEFTCDFSIKIKNVHPGGQDSIPSEAFVAENTTLDEGDANAFVRETPVVIEISQTSVGSDFTLAVNEVAKRFVTRTVRLDLHTVHTSSAGKASVVILDRNPFLVADVEFDQFLTQNLTDASSLVAQWSNSFNEGASWQIRSGQEHTASLVLPPQAVGETMEYKGRLIDKKADFRLSPPTVATIFPSYNIQRFIEAPWNLRRIVGYVGQRAPGAQIKNLQYELLYGLSCSTDYPFMRLAEIWTQFGQISGRLPVDIGWDSMITDDKTTDPVATHYSDFRHWWAQVYRQYLNRVALLEPWDAHQPGSLVLNDHLSCTIRGDADMRRPIEGVCDSPNTDPFLRGTDDDHALEGGAIGGFESNNVYCAVMRNRQSTAAQLENALFGALGGYGTTAASFDKGLTKVTAEVISGRTEVYTLERFGRIAVLWNKAKHVIVYERSADESGQGYLELPDPKPQNADKLRGRPLLRKVREYIEIIEEVRAYPEGSSAPSVRGFVAGSDFRTAKVIPVEGDWGRDVRNVGWQVPLWNPAVLADDIAKSVYPRPKISLSVVCDDGGQPLSRPAEMQRPELLYFYTSTEPNASADSNDWSPVTEVDYPNFPLPPCPVPNFASASVDHSITPPTVPSGYKRFTFELAPAPLPINIVTARTEKAITAMIENVTIARSAGISHPAGDINLTDEPRLLETQLLKKYNEIAGEVAALSNVTPDIAQQQWDKTIVPEMAKAKSSIDHSLFGDLLANLASGTKTKQDLCNFVTTQADTAFNTFLTTAISAERTVVDRIVAFAPATRDLLLQVSTTVTEWTPEAVDGELSARIAELRHDLEQWPQTPQPLRKLALAMADWKVSVLALIGNYDNLKNGAIDAVKQVNNDLNRDLTFAERAAVDAIVDNLERAIGAYADSLQQAIDRSRPAWLPAMVLPTYKFEEQNIRRMLLVPLELHQYTPTSGVAPKLQDVLAWLNKLPSAQDLQTPIAAIDFAAWQKSAADLWGSWVEATCSSLQSTLTKLVQSIPQPWTSTKLENAANAALSQLQEAAGDSATSATKKLADDVGKKIHGAVDNVCNQLVIDAINDLPIDWKQLLPAGVNVDVSTFLRLLEQQIHGVLLAAQSWLEQASRLPGSVHVPDSLLRILRAMGEPPQVPGLNFSRAQLGYFFDSLIPNVHLSGIIGQAVSDVESSLEAAAQKLDGFGLRVPSVDLFDRLIPAEVSNFDLSSMFPKFAGIDLSHLFSGLKMPSVGNTGIRVKHGADPQTRRGWLEADVDVPIPTDESVFAIGPVQVSVLGPHFEAHARMSVGIGGGLERTASGSITGDWILRVGGTEIVRFQKTQMIFDEAGHVRFAIAAKNIRLAPAMDFLNSLLSNVPGTGSGFSVKFLPPAAVEARLDLALPDLNFGTFGVSNLRLASSLGLDALDNFTLKLMFAIGRRDAPFNLTIFVLGGSGFIEASVQYSPFLKSTSGSSLTCHVNIGLMASASLAISLGPIRGSVALFLGVTASLDIGGSDARGFAIGILLLIRGDVSLLGIVTASIVLSLEAAYDTASGLLRGRGHFEVSIKICWCFTLNISTDVNAEFRAGALGASTNPQDNLLAASFDLSVVSDVPIFALANADVSERAITRCDKPEGEDAVKFFTDQMLMMMEY
jgi:hypothetical protein